MKLLLHPGFPASFLINLYSRSRRAFPPFVRVGRAVYRRRLKSARRLNLSASSNLAPSAEPAPKVPARIGCPNKSQPANAKPFMF